KHVENDDSKNKQEVFHGGQKVTRPFVKCQASLSTDHVDVVPTAADMWIKLRTYARGSLGAQCTSVLAVDIVSFDHAIESLSIDGEHARRGLLVSACMFENPSNVTSLDFRKGYPL